MGKNNMASILFICAFACIVLQVWLPQYFLTVDGPGHVSNAWIINNLWRGHDAAFYQQYFRLHYSADPNWLTSFLLATLMYAVSGLVAEKLLLSLYLIVYITGFYRLLRRLAPGGGLWYLVVFIFPFTVTFSFGFYNFSFGIALWFWLVHEWLSYLDAPSVRRGITVALFGLLTYFTHLLPFTFAVAACGSLILSYALAHEGSAAQRLRYFGMSVLRLMVLLLPAVCFSVLFLGERSTHGSNSLIVPFSMVRLKHLIQFFTLVNLTHQEQRYALIAGVVLLVLLAMGVACRLRSRKGFQQYDGFYLTVAIAAFVYLFFSESVFGQLMLISIRALPFVFIAIVCAVSYSIGNAVVRNVAGVIIFACFGMLSIYRIACRAVVSRTVAEVLSVGDSIRPYATVLPLVVSKNGRDAQGRIIADRFPVFQHVGQYLSLQKPLVVMDNFEAGYGYFPLLWLPAANPYDVEVLNKKDGLEGEPPYADIAAWEQRSGHTMDYVLLCFPDDPPALRHPGFASFCSDLRLHYQIVKTSATGRAVLLRRR